jgi:hypothetical protein
MISRLIQIKRMEHGFHTQTSQFRISTKTYGELIKILQ